MKHNLHNLFRKLNHLYFEGRLNCRLSWGIARSTRVRRSRRLGSYNPRNDSITLHPVLDQSRIPAHVVASVLHHEMCHAFIPSRKIKGRLFHHTPEFRKKEKEFDYYKQANDWIKKNLKFLLKPPQGKKSFHAARKVQMVLFS